MKGKPRYRTVDEYIAVFPQETQKRMQALRKAIRAAAPEAEEKISYHMAGYYLNGPLVFFAANRDHLGVYAAGGAIQAIPELAVYAAPKGTLKFAHAAPFPLALLKKAVKFRVEENKKKGAAT